jgi:predicted metalloprotease with PDZ domain
MAVRFPRAWLLVLVLTPWAPSHAVTRYTVSLSDPERHKINVAMELAAGRETHELQLPVWNALYQVRDFVQFLSGISAKDPHGKPLPLVQINKGRWLLQGASKGVKIEYQVFSDRPGPFGAQLNSQHAFVNLAEILLYAEDTRRETMEVDFANVPGQWKIAIPLAKTRGVYEAGNYDELVDSPVEIGPFAEKDLDGPCGKYHVVVDDAHAEAIFDKIIPSIQRIVTAATEWMNDCPFQSYTFIYHFSDSPDGGGMEHACSTAITMPARNLDHDLEAFEAITAHEFFHLWDVKRIRPQSLEPADYTKENYTNALWFSEGADTTAANCIRLRAGLLGERRYLDHLAQAITELQNQPAHLTQSAEQSSIDAWLEKYPYYGLPERSISYYNKGELLGTLLDLKLRQSSQGRASLQTLFRWMNEHYAKAGKFFADSDGVRDAAEKVTGADFREFFSNYVGGVQEIPWDAFFSFVGLQTVTVEATYADPGFEAVHRLGQPPTVVRLQPGSEAERSGLKPDDVIVAVNGKTVGRNFEQQIEALEPGTLFHIRVRRQGLPLELQWTLNGRKVIVYRLEDWPAITREQRMQQKTWLSGISSPSIQ